MNYNTLKKNVVLLISFFLTVFCYNGYSQVNKADELSAYKVDSIEGEFLYEATVPYACYIFGDAIAQGASIIPFCDTCDIDVEQLYKKGFFMRLYSKPLQGLFEWRRMNEIYREQSVQSLLIELDFPLHAQDSTYLNGLLPDKSGILKYKRFYAKLKFVNFGAVECLIPDLHKYKCCYANRKVTRTVRAIVEVVDFKML